MSPRAAARLEQLGFRQVYDYAGGRPTGSQPRYRSKATDSAGRRGTRSCERCPPAAGSCSACWQRDAEGVTVAEAMEPGPTTVRASRQLEPLLEALAGDAESFALVTDSDGRLLGVVRTVSDGSRSPVPDR
jgi:hypothetical protein